MSNPDFHASSTETGAPDLRLALDQAGWRFTRQRAAVYQFLCSVEHHPTAEEVYRSVRCEYPKISLATVYKALEALVGAGVAQKLANAEGPARYDWHCENHYHLRCMKTGQVRDLETPYDPQLLEKLDPHLVEKLRRQGFHATHYRLEILGHFDDPDNG